MKRIFALLLCAVLAALLSFTASAESGGKSLGLDPPRVFIEPDGGCVNFYIDGITDEYISAYNNKYIDDASKVKSYILYVDFGSIFNYSHYYFLSYIRPDYITTPYRIDAEHSLPYVEGEESVYEETAYDMSYYDINDGTLTSGYLFKVYDKDAEKNMTAHKYIDSIYIAAYADEDGKDCIEGSWTSYFAGVLGGNEDHFDERMKITFLGNTDADTPSEPAKASPDTGASDIAAIIGLAIIAAGITAAAKKKK